jgi:hypothetical protein
LPRKACHHKCAQLAKDYGVQSMADSSGRQMTYRFTISSTNRESVGTVTSTTNDQDTTEEKSEDVTEILPPESSVPAKPFSRQVPVTATRAKRVAFIEQLLESNQVITLTSLRSQLGNYCFTVTDRINVYSKL